MELETKSFHKFVVLENDNGKIIEAKIKLHGIYINVSIILSKNIIVNYEIDQCKNIISNFLKIFEGERWGIIPMKTIIKGINFSNIVMDYINGIITLIVHYQYSKKNFYVFSIEFNNEYEIEKIEIIK